MAWGFFKGRGLKFYLKLLAPLHILSNFGGIRFQNLSSFLRQKNSAPLEIGEAGWWVYDEVSWPVVDMICSCITSMCLKTPSGHIKYYIPRVPG